MTPTQQPGRPKSKLRIALEQLREDRTLSVLPADCTKTQLLDTVRNVSRAKKRRFSVRTYETHFGITRLL